MEFAVAFILSVLAAFTLGAITVVAVLHKQRICYHHDPYNGNTYIVSTLIDTGMRKLWWCTECKQRWIP